ncbi:hypothetical protein [Arsenophonus apicola]|uniref:Uncharacterized protein n=1 Tax=Arsenophonus apicola TaxID=2879119 RepID=A0ABY8P4X2_9GAMM|nr:hypothetical protein [Arsenophonus apicola]WGO84542.1 hypothetical protein QG404_06600 [Arsenophonus apicola]
MFDKYKATLYAAASVLDIWSARDYSEMVEKETILDAINGDINRVLSDLDTVINREIKIKE